MRTSMTLCALLCAALIAGCSSKKAEKEAAPASLQKINAELSLKTEWSTRVGKGQGKLWTSLHPALDSGAIYVADSQGQVLALDRYDGKKIWQRKLKKTEISGGVGVGQGMVLLGTLAGEVIALDSNTGDELWRSQVGSEVLAAPGTNGEVVVVQTQDDRLLGLDAYTGASLWVYESTPAVLTLRGTSTPLVTDYVVFAGLSTGKLVALELEHGLPLWEQRIAVPSGRTELERIVDVDGSLVLKDNVLYATAYNGTVVGLEAESGRVLWQREASSHTGVAQGYGNAFVSLDTGVIEGVDERSSSTLWSNDQLLHRQPTAPAAFSTYVAVADQQGYVHLLSQVDGRFVARNRVDSKGVRVAPLVDGGWMYVYGNSGKLVALTIK